jgi:hypothetical protein
VAEDILRVSESADQVILSAPAFQLIFDRIGPRWTHSLELRNEIAIPTGSCRVAAAVEHDPDRDRPEGIVSPVYQELQIHTSAELPGACALLTGHLHQHHFSAAVRLVIDIDGDDPGPPSVLVDFDVADRCRETVDHFAATYTAFLTSGDLADADPRRIAWNLGEPMAGRLDLAASSSSSLALAEAGRGATRVQAVAAIETGTFTHRLRYRWRWASTSGMTR